MDTTTPAPPMPNFLTQGRTALLSALQADEEISARVKTWFDFGPGLRRRFHIAPAACPLLALSPVEGAALRTSNAFRDITQRLRIEVATDSQDAEPCEELVALTLECVRACDEDALGLAGDGLTGVAIESVSWRPLPDASGPRLLWVARVDVALLWKRT